MQNTEKCETCGAPATEWAVDILRRYLSDRYQAWPGKAHQFCAEHPCEPQEFIVNEHPQLVANRMNGACTEQFDEDLVCHVSGEHTVHKAWWIGRKATWTVSDVPA